MVVLPVCVPGCVYTRVCMTVWVPGCVYTRVCMTVWVPGWVYPGVYPGTCSPGYIANCDWPASQVLAGRPVMLAGRPASHPRVRIYTHFGQKPYFRPKYTTFRPKLANFSLKLANFSSKLANFSHIWPARALENPECVYVPWWAPILLPGTVWYTGTGTRTRVPPLLKVRQHGQQPRSGCYPVHPGLNREL